MRKASILTGVLCVSVLAGAAWAQGQSNDNANVRADGRGDRTRQMPPRAPAGTANTTGNGIDYHGGPVLLGTTNVYYIWYGNWSSDTAVTILTDLANTIGGSPYFNINTTYFNGSNQNVSNSVHFGGSTTDNYSHGTSLADSDIQAIVSSAITSGHLPLDTNGLYLVLTSADVNETSGFCTAYCGWHTYGTISGSNIKYSFVGNGNRCPGLCYTQSPGPNGNAGADGMASVISHELEETVTDPNLNAWYDSAGNENADKCAWNFGPTYTAPNGQLANMHLGAPAPGGRDFLIQQNWVNAAGGYCAQSYTAIPDFTLSATPTTQVVNGAGAGASYAINVAPLLGFTGDVALSVTSALPAGVTATFTTNTVTGGSGSSTLNVTTSASTPVAIYTITVKGVSGALNHTVSLTLNIADFSISPDPATRSVAQGGQTTYTLTISALDAFSGSVSLSASGLPAGATASFLPSTVNTSGQSFVTVSTLASTPTGTFNVTFTGVGPFSTHTTSVSLTVTVPPPDFTLSASPSSQSVNPGSSTAPYTVTINPLNGFSSSVGFTISGLPSGATPAFSPNPATAGTSLTISTTGATAAGSYPLTITGTSGSLVHTASATLVVNALGSIALSATPSSISVTRPRGGSANVSTTINITRGGNFTGNVSLSVSGLPSQASASFSPNPAAGGSSTLTVTVSKKTAGGTFNLSVTGAGGAGVTSGTTPVTLTVN